MKRLKQIQKGNNPHKKKIKKIFPILNVMNQSKLKETNQKNLLYQIKLI